MIREKLFNISPKDLGSPPQSKTTLKCNIDCELSKVDKARVLNLLQKRN